MEDKTINAGLNEFKDKVTSINAHLKYLEMVLSGHRWTGEGDKYIYTGEVLAGAETINTAISLLTPYTHESNLITVKNSADFAKQIYYTSMTFLRETMVQEACRSEHQKKIFEMFYETLINIGDIILSSKGTIELILSDKEGVSLT